MSATSLFMSKGRIRVGCWNVRSLGNPSKQNGRLMDVLRTMKKKKIEVLALSEVRWPGHGVAQVEDAMIAHSGMAISSRQFHRHGVAVVFSERAAAAWREARSVFDPMSDRMLKVRMKLHTGSVSIIAVYAPTNEPKNEGSQWNSTRLYRQR